MAGRNRKTSAIKDIDELEKEQKVEEKNPLENIVDISEKIEIPDKIVHEEIIPTEEAKKFLTPSPVNLRKVEVDPWLNVRNKPSMLGSEIVSKLFTGDIVEIFAIKDGFAKISETEDKWVSMDYLVPVYSKEQLEK